MPKLMRTYQCVNCHIIVIAPYLPSYCWRCDNHDVDDDLHAQVFYAFIEVVPLADVTKTPAK